LINDISSCDAAKKNKKKNSKSQQVRRPKALQAQVGKKFLFSPEEVQQLISPPLVHFRHSNQ